MILSGVRGFGGKGVDGVEANEAASDLGFWDRRGGGRSGFTFSSSSCSSLADTNEVGEEGISLLSSDAERLLWKEVERGRS